MSNHRAEVFISYCWENENIAKTIYEHLNKKVNLHLDKIDIDEWNSIKEFMQSIGKMDYVILLISDDYLKSENCMYEVLEVLRDRKYQNKILPVTIGEKMYASEDRVKYVKYWQDKYADFNNEIKDISLQNIGSFGKRLKQLQDISSNIADFLDVALDMKNPDIENVSIAIERRLKKEGVIPQNKRHNLWWILILLVLLVVGLCVFFIVFSKDSSREAPESEPPKTYVIDFNEEYRELTDDDIATLIEDAQSSIVIYNEDDEYNIEDMRNLVLDRILNNPIYGDAVARGFLQLDEIMSGEITAQNQWLITFISETDSAMDSPKLYREGMRRWLVKTQGRISTRDSYKEYADFLCTLLNSFFCDSVDEFHSTTCWSVEADASGIYTRAVENSKNATRPALTMCFRYMNGNIACIFGIAIDDGSFCICNPEKWGIDSFVE